MSKVHVMSMINSLDTFLIFILSSCYLKLLISQSKFSGLKLHTDISKLFWSQKTHLEISVLRL